MSNMTTTVATAVLDGITGHAAYTAPGTLYLALQTAAQSAMDGTVNGEVTGSGYARMPIVFGAASAGSASNNALIDFGLAAANWGTITNFAICSGPTGNNALEYGALGSSITVNTGQSCQVRVGQISLTLG